MTLAIGARIGAYEILAPLGMGGMGEVYRARDTRLKRDVALKILPGEFANDPARMARFQREAELLASLNHPGIAHVYGIEENAFVMEPTGLCLAIAATLAIVHFREAPPVWTDVSRRRPGWCAESSHPTG